MADFTNKCTWQEATEENNNPEIFVPGSGVRHRPLKSKSIEGTFVNKKENEERKGQCIQNCAYKFGKTTTGGKMDST